MSKLLSKLIQLRSNIERQANEALQNERGELYEIVVRDATDTVKEHDHANLSSILALLNISDDQYAAMVRSVPKVAEAVARLEVCEVLQAEHADGLASTLFATDGSPRDELLPLIAEARGRIDR